MAKYKVDEFTVELGFSEKILSGLTNVEKKVNNAAERIEKRFNQAFNRLTGAEKTGNMFARIERQATTAANHIQKEMARAFNMKANGASTFSELEQQSARAGQIIQRNLNNALKFKGFSLPVTSPAPKVGRPSIPPATKINDIYTRAQQSAFFGNMQIRTPERAEEYTKRLTSIFNNAGTDVAQFRRNVHALNYEFSQMGRAEAFARQKAQQLGDSVNSPISGFGKLVTGLYAASQAIQYFSDSVRVGAERQQAKVMLETAYGKQAPEITQQVNTYANKYGVDKTQAQQQAAQLRMTMPEKIFSNSDIPKLLETESVFMHQTGGTADSLARLNYAMQQIAGSAHLMGQDWLQVVNASPALIKQLEQVMHVEDVRALKEKALSMSGAQFTKLMVSAMEKLNSESGAAIKAQQNVLAAQGRFHNAVQDNQEKFFRGFDKGFQSLLNSLSTILHISGDDAEILGAVLGDVFSRLSSVVDEISTVVLNVNGALGLIEVYWIKFFNDLPTPMQNSLKKVSDILVGFIETITGIAALNKIKQFTLGTAKRAGSLLGKSGAEVAEAGAESAGKGLSRFIPGAGQLLAGWDVWEKWKTLSDSITQGTKGSTSVWDAIQKRAHGWASYKEGDSFNGNLKGLPDWLTRTITIPENKQVNIIPKISGEVTIPLNLDIDGQIQKFTIPLQFEAQNQFENMVINNQNLRTGWEDQSQNAGWYPSEQGK